MINRILSGGVAILFVVAGALLWSAGIAVLTGWLLSILWNSTLPEMFQIVPKIDWWMGTKLMFLCSFLFKSSSAE